MTPAAKQRLTPFVRRTIESKKYFCANTNILHKAATQIRERCEQMHGMECCDVINTRVKGKGGKLKNYTAGDCDYDLRCMWPCGTCRATTRHRR